MSDAKITVSDGTDFFRIPISDLQEACEDGFYVPSLRQRTIVSDGKELFEIPLEDLPEAQADGFIDVLVAERGEVATAKVMLQKAGLPAAPPTAAAVSAKPAEPELPAVFTQPASEDSVQFAHDETVTIKSPVVRRTSKPKRQPKPDPKPAPKPAADDVDEPLLKGVEPESEETGIRRFLMPDNHPGGKGTWQVMAINIAIHVAIVAILALIILPTPDIEILMEITSSFEPSDPVKMDFESVEIDQPMELENETSELEVVNMSDVLTENTMDIDVSDMELSVPDSIMESDAATGPKSLNSKSELAGRSKAGRASAVAKRGGNAASEAAVLRGLHWMASHQYPDGGWSFDHTQGECKGQCSQPGQLTSECRNAATGMALLTLLGAGQTPYSGDFQEEVRRGVAFMLENGQRVPAGVDLRGVHAHNTGMYTHAIATTALCEILAMMEHEVKASTGNREESKNNRARIALAKKLRPVAKAGIDFIVNAQHENGGWGYNPGTAGDTSILGWQIMALKSAAHAKIAIPGRTIIGANQFLNSVQTPDGWFGYRKPEKKASTTAIGLISRMLSGMKRSHPQLKQGVAHLSATGPANGNMYFNYYATQVMMHYGGDYWKKWNEVMRDRLVKTQITEGHAAGSWDLADTHGRRAGRLYMTCLCTMTLEVYYRHLPLYGEPDELEEDTETASR